MHVATELSLTLGALCKASGPGCPLLIVLDTKCVSNANIRTGFIYDTNMDHACRHDWGSPLVPGVGQVPLGWLVVVDNGDVGTFGNHVNVAEVATVGDV